MKTEGKIWIIFNSSSKIQSKPLSISQAQSVLLSIPTEQHKEYFIWTPGWTEWQNVEDYFSTGQSYFALHQPTLPGAGEKDTNEATVVTQGESPPNKNIETEQKNEDLFTAVFAGKQKFNEKSSDAFLSQDFSGEELDLSKVKKVKPPSELKQKSGAERRQHTRVNFKIEIVLISDSGSFRTHSKDISLSGTQLEDEIPAQFINNRFDLVIVNPFEKDPAKARLHFKSKILSSMSDRRRLAFIEVNPEMTARLDALLKAYMAYQQQMEKNKIA